MPESFFRALFIFLANQCFGYSV